MAKSRNGIHFNIDIDRATYNWFNQVAPHKLKEARKNAVKAAGMVWADEAKAITTEEDHIDTGLYVNSIGYSTGSPSSPIYQLEEGASETSLDTGANVVYAAPLEKRFGIMARALDRGKDRMERVAETQVKNTLGL